MDNTDIQSLIDTLLYDSTIIDSEEIYSALLQHGEVAIQALLDAIHDTSHDEHHTIASVLCDILVDIGDEDAISVLLNLVNHPNNQVFTPAVRSLARCQTPNINHILCQLLEHPAPQVRRVVAWQLGRNRAISNVNCLLSHLNESDIETLRGIIWSLGHIGDHRIVLRLEPFTNHMSNDIAFIAREAIQRIKDKSLNLPFK